MEGTFTLVAAMNVTHAAKDTVIAPGALPDSGDLHLVVVRDTGCCSMVKTLLSFEDGNIDSLSHVEILPVRAFRLEPGDNRGIYSLDGERLPTEPIQVEVIPGVLRMFGFEKPV